MHDALRARFGPLIGVPTAHVVIDRRVTLTGALRERYEMGRVFSAKRIEHISKARRWMLGAGECLGYVTGSAPARTTRTFRGSRGTLRGSADAWIGWGQSELCFAARNVFDEGALEAEARRPADGVLVA